MRAIRVFCNHCSGEVLPWWAGVAYRRPDNCDVVIAPLGLNLLIRLFRAAYFRLRGHEYAMGYLESRLAMAEKGVIYERVRRAVAMELDSISVSVAQEDGLPKELVRRLEKMAGEIDADERTRRALVSAACEGFAAAAILINKRAGRVS